MQRHLAAVFVAGFITVVAVPTQAADQPWGEMSSMLDYNKLCIKPDGGLGAWNGSLVRLVSCGYSTPPDQYDPSYFWSTAYAGQDDDGVYVQFVNQGRLPGARLCLDLTNGNGADGTLIQLWECRNTNGQIWHIRNDGTIRNYRSGDCLDVRTGGSGLIQNWHCGGGDENAAQHWAARNDFQRH